MSVILLTTNGRRGLMLKAAIDGRALVVDEVIDVYTERPDVVNAWGVTDVPALIKLHDGRAVWQIHDADEVMPSPLMTAAIETAVAAYDAAKAGP